MAESDDDDDGNDDGNDDEDDDDDDDVGDTDEDGSQIPFANEFIATTRKTEFLISFL